MIDAGAVVKMGLVSVELRTEDSEHEENPIGEQLIVDASISMQVPDVEEPQAKVASAHETIADNAALEPRRSEDIDHGAMRDLLMERL
jgi:hypothetical protein